jgi:hypothetical protein
MHFAVQCSAHIPAIDGPPVGLDVEGRHRGVVGYLLANAAHLQSARQHDVVPRRLACC